MTDQSWRINPDHLPRRLEVEIQPEVYERLERLSAATGRSIRDLAEELIYRQAAQLPNP